MYLITSAISGIFGLIFLVAWVLLSLYSMINIIRNPNVNQGLKILWILVIVVIPILGALVYLFWKNIKDY
jgi:O-antigen ligase